jgi:hypothetical protein
LLRNTFRLLLGIVVVAGVAIVGIRALNPSVTPATLRAGVSNALAQRDAPDPNACRPDHPAFYYGFASLHMQLGEVMGSPVECEHAVHVNGDTRQRTSTGYAYYRKSDNIPTFTNGWDHWSLTQDGLVHWTGYVVDPPSPSTAAGLGS